MILMDVTCRVLTAARPPGPSWGLDRPDTKAVPIFAMTANTFAEDEEKSREPGWMRISLYMRLEKVLSQVKSREKKRSR